MTMTRETAERAMDSKAQAAPFTEAEQRAWVPLVQGMLHLLATLDDELKRAFDLSHLDYGILMLLRLDPTHRRRMTELATTFGVEPNVITYRVQRMEAHGWAQRGRCDVDKRGVYAEITAEGLALVEQAQSLHVAGVRRRFLDHVSPAQLIALAEIFGPLHAGQRMKDDTPTDHAIVQPRDRASGTTHTDDREMIGR